MKIGFIGLGSLGTPIAENILHKQEHLFVYNRTAARAQPFVERGATVCASIKELAEKCDVIFSIVSDDAALNNITKGNGGVAQNLKTGGIHISMSTILPETASELAETHKQHGSYYIASPVMGRPEAARAGKLNFLASGDKIAIELIKPLLQDAGGAGIWEFGNNPAAANVAKLCSNFLIISAVESMAEGINLAKKSGLDAAAWINMITKTLFAAPVYIGYSDLLLKEKFQPAGFALRLGLKDINLVMQQSGEAGAEMPVGSLIQQRLKECVARGLGDHDLTAVALTLK
jgi:3-hydroxyisobutyrate dehydrogenase-like beta-hydroxyacid dehydrogenase